MQLERHFVNVSERSNRVVDVALPQLEPESLFAALSLAEGVVLLVRRIALARISPGCPGSCSLYGRV